MSLGLVVSPLVARRPMLIADGVYLADARAVHRILAWTLRRASSIYLLKVEYENAGFLLFGVTARKTSQSSRLSGAKRRISEVHTQPHSR